jgi:hypothetical protein
MGDHLRAGAYMRMRPGQGRKMLLADSSFLGGETTELTASYLENGYKCWLKRGKL